MPLPGVSRGAPPPSAEVVIVGAGVQGLALAYELARRGVRDLCVLDRSWPGSGASGRNGQMVRSAFSSDEWSRLFSVAHDRWRVLAAELEVEEFFTVSGYLILASTEDELTARRADAAAHRASGIATTLLSEAEVRELAPALNPALVRGGVYQPDGGFARHDDVVRAYAAAAARLGVRIHAFTEVTSVIVRGERVVGVETPAGRIAAPIVVDAAGGRARAVAALAGVSIPTRTMRLEAIVTETLAPFLTPAVALVHQLGYCHQSLRGEFVGGTEQKVQPAVDSLRTTFDGVRDAAQKFVRAFPCLAGARLVRHWAGVIDVAADLAPILCETEVGGFWLDCGWVYGFMGAPAGGQLLAEAITTGAMPPPALPFSLSRLREGRLIAEGSLVVVLEGT